MYGHTYSKSQDKPGKVANPARGQMAVPSRSSLLISILRLNLVLTYLLRDSSCFPRRRPFIHLNRHTPSSQSRVYRVTQLRADGVHWRESAGAGPVNLNVVPVTGAAFASPWAN